jgi:hypothetical protein
MSRLRVSFSGWRARRTDNVGKNSTPALSGKGDSNGSNSSAFPLVGSSLSWSPILDLVDRSRTHALSAQGAMRGVMP